MTLPPSRPQRHPSKVAIGADVLGSALDDANAWLLVATDLGMPQPSGSPFPTADPSVEELVDAIERHVRASLGNALIAQGVHLSFGVPMGDEMVAVARRARFAAEELLGRHAAEALA